MSEEKCAILKDKGHMKNNYVLQTLPKFQGRLTMPVMPFAECNLLHLLIFRSSVFI